MSHPLVERILSGEAPEAVRQAGARGVLPIPREDQIELWACLRNDGDPDIRLSARENLAAVDASEWRPYLRDHEFRPEVFDFASKTLSRQDDLAAALLQNRALPDVSFAYLAGTLKGGLLDQILDNQSRLIRHPNSVVALLSNPALTPSQARRLSDLSEQFFREHSQIPALLEERFGFTVGHAGGDFSPEISQKETIAPPLPPIPAPPKTEKGPVAPNPALAPLSKEEEVGEGAGGLSGEEGAQEGEAESQEHQTLFQRLLTMSVPQKIGLAFNGDKEARGLLIRDSNKVVQEAVLNSPKLTDGEVEAICKMRNLSEEILRKVARNQEWMKQYSIVKALVSNAKTPPGVVLPLVFRLNDFDLKQTIKDKNVAEIVRREAKKIYEIRHTPKKSTFKKG